MLDPETASGLPTLGTLPGDIRGYWMRFILSFSLLYGLKIKGIGGLLFSLAFLIAFLLFVFVVINS